MRINENALKHRGRTADPDREGRLQYKSPKENYRQRWFKLVGNLLFYFRTNEMGQQAESEPSGVILLERCKVQLENLCDRPFAFSIEFAGDVGRQHFFSGQTQKSCEEWVTSLSMASIEHLKAELALLRNKIHSRTGKDPMEDVHKRIIPSQPAVKSRLPSVRVPSRPAPCPPQSTSKFYSQCQSMQPITHLPVKDPQKVARPWVKPIQTPTQESTKPSLSQPTSRSVFHTSGTQEEAGKSSELDGWEIFQ